MASDFHTHHLPPPGVRALHSGTVPLDGVFNALELHPWRLPENFAPQEGLAERLRDFDALGEIGLDRLRGPKLPVQQEFLRAYLSLACELEKPVVLHVVRSFPEIMAMLKTCPLRVMIHGFRGTPALLDELWERGYTVSFHHAALDKPDLRQKLFHPAGPFGFESDDDPTVSVCDLLAKCPQLDAETITDQYFADFLRI